MQNFKLTIAYDGTHYAGWQVQKNAPTVQETIEKVLHRILQEKVHLIGASRTDAGVHALGQVANFKCRGRFETRPYEDIREILLKGLNGLLPCDIRVLKIEKAPLDFHAQYNAKKKLYRYTIIRTNQVLPQERFFVYHYPHPLNVSSMRQAAKYLVGTHDFASFQGKSKNGDSPHSGTVPKIPKIRPSLSTRRIYRLQILQKKDRLIFRISANGFLYTMVRTIVGTLLEVGSGKRTPWSFKELLTHKDRTLAGTTISAKGLCLLHIIYQKQR